MPKQKPNEQVQQIPLSEIRPFKNHPFKVTDDELMQQTIDSIMQVGVLNPAIIRPAPEGGYEMVAGHRRLHAADLAGLKTIPAIVRNLDDDEAVILKLNRLENRKKYLEKGERQKRTHRLCNLGGTIESLAPEVKDLTRTEMTELMEHIFSLSEVQRAVRHMAITHISQANREKELKADGTISSKRHAD